MNYFLILTKANGEKIRVEIEPGSIISVEAGDDVAVYDENGDVAEVILRPEDEHLRILFESGEHVVLNNFYKTAEKSDEEEITVSTSNTSKPEGTAALSFGEGVGNLPAIDDFTLMRLSNTGYIGFDQATTAGPSRATAGTSQPEDPVANPDSASVLENGTVTLDLLANDQNSRGNPLMICEVGGVNLSIGQTIQLRSGSSITLLADGTIEFIPSAAYESLAEGEITFEEFSYVACDELGNSSTATARIEIRGENDPPTANNDIIDATEGLIATINPLNNDTDPDTSDTLTITGVQQPAGGSVQLNPDGSLSFDPGSDFDHLPVGATATQTITYSISDGNGGTDTAEITITVTGVNDDPVANPDTAPTDEDTPIVLDPLGNDTDVDGDPLNICGIEVGGIMINPTPGVPITLDSGAIVTVMSDGTIQYDQNGVYEYLDGGESATDIFTYKIDDGNGGTATSTFTVEISGVEDPTVTNPDAETTNEDTTVVVDVLLNDSDLDASDNPLTVAAITTPPSSGSVTINPGGGDVSFDPGTDFQYLAVGESATVTFTYQTNTGATEVATVTVTGVNDDPVANPDTDTVPEDTPITLTPLANDTDPDGSDTLNICGIEVGGVMVNPTPGVPITLDSGAVITVLANGDIQYDQNGTYEYLDDGESATDIFTYKIDDGNGGTSTSTYTVTITGSDDPTIVNPDAETTNEDTPVVVDVLLNDSDPDASDNPLTVASIVSPPSSGSVTINPGGGDVSFDPGTDFQYLAVGESATVTFTYQTNTGATEVATVTVTGVNDDPVANPDTDTVPEDTPITLTPLANDTDPDGSDTLNICGIEVGGVMVNPTPGVPITLDSGAVITVLANGDIQYDQNGTYEYLDDGESATDIFTYKIDDGNGGTSTSTYTVTITGADDPTITNPDAETGAEDTPISGDVLLNDSDPDASDNPLTVVSNTNPTNGTVVVNPDGTFTYTPNANYTGTDTFTYTTSTGATDTVTITVTPVNDPPVANPDTDTTDEDTPVNVDPLANDTDPDGDPLNICGIEVGGVMVTPTPGVPITLDSGATVTLLADGTIDYDSNGVHNSLDAGESATDIFTYKIDDGNGGTSTSTFTVTVNGVEDPTITNPDAESGAEDTPISGDVLLNDSDPDASDNPLTVVSNTNPTNGTVVVNPDGTFTYTPNANFTGTDTFTYTTSTGATDTVTITVNPVNDPPNANPDTGSTDEDTPVNVDPLANDTDPDGDPLNICGIEVGGVMVTPTPGVPITLDSGATVTLLADGTIDYDSNGIHNSLDAGESATDIFTYKIDDGNGGTSTSTFTVTVNGVEDPTVTNPDTGTTDEDTPLIGGSVLGNDSDPDASDNPLTVVSNTAPTNGTVVVNPDGTYTYTPNANFTGTDTFTYTTNTGATDTVTITVNPVNDPPTANPDTTTVDEDTPVNLTPLPNDTDPDGDALNVCGIEVGGVMVTPTPGVPIVLDSGATVTLLAGGILSYDQSGTFDYLDNGESATDIFTYKIDDGNGGTATTTYTVTINGIDDATVTNPDNGTTDEDTPLIGGSVLGNDSDPDASDNPLTVVSNTNPSNGTVIVNPDGTYTYTPNANFTGTDTFTYTTSTGATDTVTITVNPVNDPPVAVDDQYVIHEGASITTTLANDLLGNDSDPESDPITVNSTPVTDVSNGTLTLNGDGTFTYVPNPGFNGTDTFVYEISDGNGGTATATATIVIDNDGDGVDNATDIDDDNDGILDAVENGVDSDSDGLFDHLDIDADNDGITDNVEAQTTQDYIAPSGSGAAFVDANNDGLDDNYDNTTAAGMAAGAAGVGLTPVDTDSDGTADYVDTDSDDDGINDVDEAGHGVSQAVIDASGDADNDGLMDAVEGSNINDGHDVNDENLDASNTNFNLAESDNDTAPDGSNAAPTGTDFDYRDDAGQNVSIVKNVSGGFSKNADGTFTVPLTVVLENIGSVDLANPNILDNVEDSIGNFFQSINSISLDTSGVVNGTAPTINPSWDGASWDWVLSGGNLEPGDSLEVSYNLVVSNPTDLTNLSTYTGYSLNGVDTEQLYWLDNNDESFTGQFNADANSGWGGTFSLDITDNSPGSVQNSLITQEQTHHIETNSGDDVIFGDTNEVYIRGGGDPADPINDFTLDYDFTGLENGYLPAGTTIWFRDIDIVGVEDVTVSGVSTSGTNSSFITPLADSGTGTSLTFGYDAGTNTHSFTPAGAQSEMRQGFVTTEDMTSLSMHLPHGSGNGGYGVMILAPTDLPDLELETQAYGYGEAPDGSSTWDNSDDGTDTLGTNPGFLGDTGGSDDPTVISIPCVEVEQEIIGTPVASASGVPGNLDYTFQFTITNDGLSDLESFTLLQDFASDFGGAFVGIVPQGGDPAVITQSDASDPAEINSAYDGGASAGGTNIFDATSSHLGPTGTITIQVVVEIDPDHPLATFDSISSDGTGDLETQAMVVATNPSTGQVVNDLSDDPNDPTNIDVEGDFDPDDPTVIPAPPEAIDDSGTTNEDVPVTLNLLGNDSDPNGDPLTVIGTGAAGNGTVTINPDGTVTYIPNANFNGTDTFTYTISDGNGGTDIASALVTVSPAGDPPSALDDMDSTLEDTPITINATSNDTDPDGDPLTVIATTNGTNGTVTIDGVTGEPIYTPNPDYNGTDTFTYTISDGAGGTDIATVTVSVTPVNDPPTAVDDSFVGGVNQTLSILPSQGVLGNDSDPEGDLITITSSDSVSANGGTVTVNPDGSFDFTPAVAFTGTDTFTYTISDGNGGTNVATVTVEIPDPCVGMQIAAGTNQNDEFTSGDRMQVYNSDGTLLWDTAVDGDVTVNTGTGPLIGTGDYVVYSNSGTSNGTGFDIVVTVDGMQTFNNDGNDFISAANLSSGGSPTILFQLADDAFGFTGFSSQPISADLNFVTYEAGTFDPVTQTGTRIDTSPSVVVSDIDNWTTGSGTLTEEFVQGDLSTVAAWEVAQDTALIPTVSGTDLRLDSTGSNNNSTATSDQIASRWNYQAIDEFNFTIGTSGSRGSGFGFSGSENTLVTGMTDCHVAGTPFAVDDTNMTNVDTAITVAVLANDDDPDGDILSVFSTTDGSNGTVTIDSITGNPIYTPNTGFSGTDTFTYTISDGNGGMDTASVTITVSGSGNTAPSAVDETFTGGFNSTLNIPSGQGVLGNDSDPDSDPLTIIGNTVPSNGSLTLNADGSFDYTPTTGFSGTDTFTYTISDGNGATDVASVTVDVPSPCYAASASAYPGFSVDSFTAYNSDGTVIGTHAGGTVFPSSSPGVIGDGDFIVFPGAGNFNGTSFDLVLTVLSSVEPTGTPTTINPGDEWISVGVNGGDVDVSLGEFGVLGSFNSTTPVSANLQFSFYESGSFNPATQTGISVDMNNSILVADTDYNGISVDEFVSADINTLTSYEVADQTGLVLNESATDVTVTSTIDSGTGDPLIQSRWNFHSADSFEFEIGNNSTGTARRFLFEGNNTTALTSGQSCHLPSDNSTFAINDSASTNQDTAFAGNVLTNDFDPEGHPLSVIANTNPTNGTVVFNSAGDFTYTPNTGYAGTDTFTYTISDGIGATDVATVIMDVMPSTPPVVIDLDGDGVEFNSIETGIALDVDDDGELEQTAWAAQDDAVLVFDANDNNDLDGRQEFVFADYSDDANATDLEGLRAGFDSNDDGVLDANDENFDQFKLWQDVDGDGVVDEGEMFTLFDAGIESIELTSDGNAYEAAGGDVTVHGEATVHYADGSTGIAGDASFDFEEILEDDEGSFEIVTDTGDTFSLSGEDSPISAADAELLEGCEDCGDPGTDDLGGYPNQSVLSANDEAAANGAGLI